MSIRPTGAAKESLLPIVDPRFVSPTDPRFNYNCKDQCLMPFVTEGHCQPRNSKGEYKHLIDDIGCTILLVSFGPPVFGVVTILSATLMQSSDLAHAFGGLGISAAVILATWSCAQRYMWKVDMGTNHMGCFASPDDIIYRERITRCEVDTALRLQVMGLVLSIIGLAINAARN